MKKIYITLSLVTFIFSCNQIKNTEKARNETKEKKIHENALKNQDKTLTEEDKLKYENLKIQFESPIENRYNSNVIIPIQLEEIVNKEMDIHLLSNLFFYDINTGKSSLIDTSFPGFIENFYILSPDLKDTQDKSHDSQEHYLEIGTNYTPNHIFLEIASSSVKISRSSSRRGLYKVSSKTYNYVEYTNYLALINPDGSGFTFITPVNSGLIWWKFVAEGKGILASALVDTDNNGILEDTDKIQLFYTDITNPTLSNGLVNRETQDLLTKDFMKRKKAYDKKTDN